MKFENLSKETGEKLLACKTPEELIKTASEYGVQFSDDEMARISGGADSFREYANQLFRRMLPSEDSTSTFPGPADKLG